MYNQSANSNQQQQQQYQGFGGPRGFRGGCGSGFGGRFGHKFGGGRGAWMKRFGAMMGQHVPVNIEENNDAYILHLYAAGLSKEAMQLSVKDDVLTISYKAPQSNDDVQKFSHYEYTADSFERSFQLNGKVLTEAISAAYSDGVLNVTLPKNPETARPAQQVSVS